MNDTSNKKFQTLMDNRERLTLNGVVNIESFAEDYLILNTLQGALCVEGENLKIECLEKENGNIYITGKINGIFYKEKNAPAGFFRKLFK